MRENYEKPALDKVANLKDITFTDPTLQTSTNSGSYSAGVGRGI